MKITSLNHQWYFKGGFDDDSINKMIDGQLVDIPHSVHTLPKNYFDETLTQGIFTYQKQFSYQQTKNNRLFLVCYGIMSKAIVYLNGKELMTHVGGYTKFKVELTDNLKENNLLTIKVDSHESKDHPPYGNVVDYLTYGGIYREVELLETPKNTVDHVLIDGDESKLNIRAEIDIKDKVFQCQFDILDGQKIIDTIETTIDTTSITLTHPHQLELWTTNHPKLYQLNVYLDKQLVYQSQFGVRTISVDKDGFYLNNKRIFLRGLNRHQSFPNVGYAMPASAQRKDADILKNELKVNIVRSSHYPPSRHFLNRCDELGLLVFTELPGWQHIGDETWKSYALDDLKSMVIDDYNHPSIVMIGTRINESIDDDDFYQKLQDLVKSIDQTRPTGGVRNFQKSHLLEDIYTMNDFTHRGNNQGLTKKSKVTDTNHPYLVTEHNGHMFPTKSFDNELIRVEQSLRHFKVLDDAYQMKGLMGVIGWCMNDYNTHRAFGSNDHICYHGVLDINRNAKYAASTYASQGNSPYIDVLSMMHIGERPGGEIKSVIIATNCDRVELYKGDQLIGEHYPSKQFKHLPHPPIIIDDFIGNQIENSKMFKPKDAKRIKSIMLYMLKNDLKMRLRDKIIFGYMLLKYKLTYQDAVRLYVEYVGGWGDTNKNYTFKGYINNKLIKSIEKGIDDHYHLLVIPDNQTLYHQNTYDVTRITVEMINNIKERAFYSNQTFTIETKGHIKLIGPSTRTLQGGIESFWIRSLKEGQGTVIIKSDNYSEHTIDITIKS